MKKFIGFIPALMLAALLVVAPKDVYADEVVLTAEQQAALAQISAAQQAALNSLLEQQAAAIKATQKAAEEAAAAKAAQETEQAAADAASSGMTYIDISIAAQTLTYYVNGVAALSTPCVTGSPGRSTPTGVFSINNKVPGKYLTGPTWHVWVNRWMRFSGNCGIHDASWRKSFGGNIYKSNGSHGCVNIPFSAADTLYNTAPLGTVVIVH